MIKEVIKLNAFATKENSVESVVSFKKFVDFLEEKANTDTTMRVRFFRFVLDKIRSYPELIPGVPVSEVKKYTEVLELVASIVFPLIEDENEVMFGLTNGISPEVFYASNAFHRLLASRPGDNNNGESWIAKESALEMHRQTQYDFVLQKVYGMELPQKKEMLRSYFNSSTGLYQYYRLNVDTRFVDVTSKMKLNSSCINDDISACFNCTNSFDEIEKLVPLNNFKATGFSVITLTDITRQQALEQLGKAIISINKEKASDHFTHITRLLQTMLGSSQYKFGTMPLFTVNNRAALLYENFPYSILIKASSEAGIHKSVFSRYINHYLKDPQYIVYNSLNTKNTLPVPVQEALKAAGYHYYVIAPIYFNDHLVGIMETGSAEGVPALTDLQLGKLKPSIPYISQLLKSLIDKFNISIDAIVKDKFTVIQPSVQWKFNEVAWHYYRNYNIEHRNSVLEKISFKHVHPLYGAVDIRNSTIERNKALREDLQQQLDLLLYVLTQLNENGLEENTNPLIATCRQWQAKLAAYISIEDELELNNFLSEKAHTLLASLTDLPPVLAQEVDNYFKGVDEETGISFSKRRSLENSIRLINKTIGKHFDLFKEDLQNYYPNYFEKFRTDGIEYDIYVGQSIAPKTPFSLDDVEKLRRWQVQSMATVAKLTHGLLDQLEDPLQTTQLIFVNARTIDISFRNDERRFDVEGAYNIRYHIIKKRIDKVNIYGTLERLTQPGKIAIVYFNERDAAEYVSYIQALQHQDILLDDLEHLELEELQGVTGLKALRVGVNMSE
ncbi:MAG: hypothetical protein ABJB86_02260 [Bacteroidota bacterium]